MIIGNMEKTDRRSQLHFSKANKRLRRRKSKILYAISQIQICNRQFEKRVGHVELNNFGNKIQYKCCKPISTGLIVRMFKCKNETNFRRYLFYFSCMSSNCFNFNCDSSTNLLIRDKYKTLTRHKPDNRKICNRLLELTSSERQKKCE